MLYMTSIFLNLSRLICDPRCDLSWRMFHVPLRRKCNLLFLDGMSCKYQLHTSGLMCHFKLVFPYFFLFGWFVHWCMWGVKVPYHYCVTVNFPFYGCQHLPYVLWCSYVGCIYIYNCYIFFLYWSLDHYVVSFFVSCNNLYFKFFFPPGIRIATPAFFWFPFALNIFFHPLTSVCVCP